MASTSTGYHKSIITREQPSSSGQVMSLTSGCILNVQSGAEVRVKSGGLVVSGAIVAQSSLNKAIANNGISVIESTVTNTMTINAAPKAGIVKNIISFSTLAQTIRAASAVGITFGSTAAKYYSLVVTNTTKTEELGVGIQLIGYSTKRWLVKISSPTSGRVTGSTACT